MNTRQIAAEYRLHHWAGIVRERNESGLSIKAFCERAGFHPNIYFYWQRKLREAAGEQLAGGSPEPGQTGMMPRGFTEVRLSGLAGISSLTDAASIGSLRIEVGGIRITADRSYPPAQLAELLKGVMPVC